MFIYNKQCALSFSYEDQFVNTVTALDLNTFCGTN